MKKLLIALVILAVIGAVAFGVRTVGARNETDSVDAKGAAKLVNAGGDDNIDVGDRPEAGTYTYTGTGSETVSALGGSEHVYPKEISVVHELDPEDSCAWTANVVYIEQHLEKRNYCTKDGQVIDRGFTRKIEFFGMIQDLAYDCGDDAIRLKPDAKPGDTWTWTCVQNAKTKSAYTATFIGTKTIEVGGENVKTWHTRFVSKQSGDTVGTDTSDYWLDKTGLSVKFSADLNVNTKSVLGETSYKERLTYELTSMVPKQD